ncbi:MAG: UDP-glucose 4-epimerase GalE [Polyangiaceae bacterium]|nr:UDP-glucose 4-epimerase GalE [Polyangiaceae bacterium]
MILVTGGAGYIGSHYVLHERARGAELVILDNLSRGHEGAVIDAPLVVGDIGDRTALDDVFGRYSIDAVVHFAAFAYVGESVEQPGRYYRNNVAGTLTLLEAMRDHGVRRFVLSSTCATYGSPQYLPIDERHPQVPINPYGETKVMCERMLAAFERAHGIKHVVLRYFNAAGADPEGRVGESHDPEPHLIPIVLQAAMGTREAVGILGTDYDTADGTCIRDYIHVVDLVAAHSLALDRLRADAPSAVFNLGTETGSSVREVIGACERVTGRTIRTVESPRRPGDPARLVASAARARNELGWQPKFTRLDDILATAWQWEQKKRY